MTTKLADAWRSIASAERDGRKLLLGWWDMGAFVQKIGLWSIDVNGAPGWIEEASCYGYPVELEPEVWRDLPSPPAKPKPKRKKI